MARKPTAVDAAHRRIAILRAIIRAERKRAESKPFDDRNEDLGIVAPGTPHARVPAEIAATFDELDAFLNHLGVAHIATSFEEAAKERLKTVIGQARTAVATLGRGEQRWPANLLRSLESFDGLGALSSVIPFKGDEETAFKLIRRVRNDFSHATKTTGTPAIASDDTRAVLSDLLSRIEL